MASRTVKMLPLMIMAALVIFAAHVISNEAQEKHVVVDAYLLSAQPPDIEDGEFATVWFQNFFDISQDGKTFTPRVEVAMHGFANAEWRAKRYVGYPGSLPIGEKRLKSLMRHKVTVTKINGVFTVLSNG